LVKTGKSKACRRIGENVDQDLNWKKILGTFNKKVDWNGVRVGWNVMERRLSFREGLDTGDKN
jgi:hypothetical protein